MKRTVLALLLIVNVLSAAAGPARRPPPPFIELARALALTEAQFAPVKAVFDGQRAQMQALDASNRARHQQIRAETLTSLSAILTVEQMQKLTELNANHRPMPPRDGARGAPPAPPRQ